MNKTISTAKTLEIKFNRVRDIYSLMINAYSQGPTIKRSILQNYANILHEIQEMVLREETTALGAMYKAGIITGSIQALHFLKTEFNVEPNK